MFCSGHLWIRYLISHYRCKFSSIFANIMHRTWREAIGIPLGFNLVRTSHSDLHTKCLEVD